MSDPTDTPTPAAKPEQPAGKTAARRPGWLPRGPQGWIILVSVLAVLLVAGVGVGLRYGVNTVPGLAFVEAQLNGLKIGRFGRLKISGVSGDIWRNVSIKSLIIYDEKGTWLEASDLNMRWRYHELFARRFRADAITARTLKVIRRPTLTPKEKSGAAPVSVRIDSLRVQVETLPEFSVQRGLFDLEARLAVERKGGAGGRVVARSLLHQGDFADIQFDFGQGEAILLNAKASEASGGALAGALGLAADQPFSLDAQASGTISSGRFTLLVESGETQPAKASGRWNGQGGQAEGLVRLDASSLTRGLAGQLGPQVLFNIDGAKGRGDYYDLNARLQTETLLVEARGPADLGKQYTGPGGVGVVLATPSLGRLTGEAATGAARFEGRLNGNAETWTLAGTINGSNIAAAGYSLAQARGPLSLGGRKGELTLKADLTSAGGRGEGYLAALLGPRPAVRLEAARLTDGRLLVRSAEATGAGLKVEASGSRGLLGGLSFKGTADLSNLEAARIGGKGRIRGSWSADQGGVGKPWVFTVDARGTGLAFGVSELDRLLGAAPRLRGRASLLNGAVDVADLRLDADKAEARAAGKLAANGGLAFKLDWNAEGPFRAGPVEISGKARGDGAITGTISAPRADLKAAFDAIDLPRLPLTQANVTLTFMQRAGGGDGALAVTAQSPYGPARLSTDFGFTQGGVNLSELDADAGGVKAQGSVALRRGRPSAADLTVAAGPGVLLTSGAIQGTAKITDSAGGSRAVLNLTAKNAVLRDASGLTLDDATITADGPLERLPLRIQARGDAPPGLYAVDLTGTLAEQADGWAFAFDGSGKLARSEFRTTQTARLVFGGKTTQVQLKLATAGNREGSVDLDATLAPGLADVNATLKDLPLAALNEDLVGRFDATVVLSGRGERLTGDLKAAVRNVRARGTGRTFTLDGDVTARLDDRFITIQANAASAQGLKAEAAFVLPAEASAQPFRLAIDRRREVQGRFAADGEIQPLWDLLAGGDRALSGRLAASGSLGGTLADPRLLGQARLENGSFEDGATGLKLRQVTLAASFADNAIDVSQAQGQDPGGGTVSGSGRISLQREGTGSFRLDLKRFQVIDNDIATARATGAVTLNRAADGNIRIEGDLTINRADIAAEPLSPSGVTPMAVIERNKPPPANGRIARQEAARAAAANGQSGPAINLNVGLKAARGIHVEGRGLNIELSLDARVTGTVNRPILTGEANIVQGEYDFAGKRFDFDERGSITLSTNPSQIRLNLTATREDPSLTAVIKVGGTAAKPEITLTSSPVLPQDEVLSRVLFGSSAAQLSPLEAAQLASALAALAGGGGFDVIGNVRELAGLDRLTFGGDGGLMTVAGGKYLTDDVYLEIIGGGREGTAVQVEWRVRRNFSVVSRVAGQGDARLSIRWRRDY